MYKVRWFIFFRNVARIQRSVGEILEFKRADFSRHRNKGMLEPQRADAFFYKKEEIPTPECVHCKTAVLPPCWYCLECRGKRGPGVSNHHRDILRSDNPAQ